MRNQINKLNRIRVEGNPVINTINTLNTNLRNTFNRGTMEGLQYVSITKTN